MRAHDITNYLNNLLNRANQNLFFDYTNFYPDVHMDLFWSQSNAHIIVWPTNYTTLINFKVKYETKRLELTGSRTKLAQWCHDFLAYAFVPLDAKS